jgi:acyl-CoA synthetase (AMP-forming)/AMP-acid ligase II
VNPTPAADLFSFVHILQRRCAETPDAILYTFQSDEQQIDVLTCAQLDRKARAVGAWLQTHGLAGQRVVLLYPPGRRFNIALFGCLYAGAIPAPAYPPHPAQMARTVPRLQAIVENSAPAAGLAPAGFTESLQGLASRAEKIREIRWLQLPEDLDNGFAEWRPPLLRPPDVAFLQYTSGSTAVPKGVMITHSNLIENCSRIEGALKLQPGTVGVSWLPPFHDMGLIGGVFMPVYTGFRAHLMSPLTFLQRPLRWLQTISSLRAEISGGPNFAYDFCARRISPEDKKNLDLSCWKTAFNGAEPVQWSTLQRFADAFKECGFRLDAFQPCYGLAETTLMVSGGRETDSPRVLRLERTALETNRVVITAESDPRDLCMAVTCGRPIENVTIVSAESSTGCAPDQVGEIWVSGNSVAKGYWNRPLETQQTFGAYRADNGDGPFLRTGDLGFMADGELVVTGRLKDLIIIAGRNHYPNDIELTVEESHPSIRPGCCAAFTVVKDDEERLVIAVELERRPADGTADQTEVRRAITRAVAEMHELQVDTVVVLKRGAIPKTSSGKLQRRECRSAFIRGEFYTAGD